MGNRSLALIYFVVGVFVLVVSVNLYYLNREREATAYLARTNSWVAWQVEREYLKFLNAVDDWSHDPGPETADLAFLRFDILLSRLDVVFTGPESAVLRQDEEAIETYRSLHDTLLDVEERLESPAVDDPDMARAARDEIYTVLQPYGRPLGRISNHISTGPTAQRFHEEMLWYQQISSILVLGLTGSSALVLMVLFIEARRSRRYAREQERLRISAESANTTKSAFLANMSHELRTPLNGIIGFSEMIQRETFGPIGSARYRSYIDDIHNAGLHLLGLVNTVLNVAKMERGDIELYETTWKLQESLAFALSVLKGETEKSGKQIVLDYDANHMDTIYVHGDKKVFDQIFINLIGNAIKFTNPRGTISIDLIEDSDGIGVTISDDGIGISREDLDRIFEPFFQSRSGMDRPHQGTGLGLPISRDYARLHECDIVMDSTPGVGTTATLRLPSRRLSYLTADNNEPTLTAGSQA